LIVIYSAYYLEEGDQYGYGLLARLNAASILLHTKTGINNK